MAESERTFEQRLADYGAAEHYRLSSEDIADARAYVIAHVAAIEAERDRAVKDSERLDWLSRLGASSSYGMRFGRANGWHVSAPNIGGDFDHGTGCTLREAIDAAMTPEPKDASA